MFIITLALLAITMLIVILFLYGMSLYMPFTAKLILIISVLLTIFTVYTNASNVTSFISAIGIVAIGYSVGALFGIIATFVRGLVIIQFRN